MQDIRKNQRSNKKSWLFVVIGALLVATISHLYFIYLKNDGILMTGINDGLSQMLPFKQFIYEQYTNGNFFYSDSFGLGGGFFSQLGYYFTTNLFYIFHVIIIFILELLGFVEHPDVAFWADAILPMSILKLTLSLLIATYYFRQIKFGFLASFLGAVVYAVNVLYFRHTMYWDFFSDAFIWFMLLLIGIERIIQKKSGTLFVIAVACNMITNFYFAYINFLLAIFYILLRLAIRFFKDEEQISRQLVRYTYLGIIGALISAVAFIPIVAGFFNNYRPEYTDPIPWLELTDNILFHSRVMFLPIFIVMFVCIWRFYKHPIFRFFAFISVAGTLLHFVPLVGSMFNGFSAPQNRWEHIIGLAFGGVVAFTFQHIKKLTIRDYGVGLALYLVLAVLIIRMDDYTFDQTVRLIIPVISILMVLILIGMKKLSFTQQKRIFFISISLFMIIVANTYQAARLTVTPSDRELATEDFIESEAYNSKEQRNILEALEQGKATPHSRIDWMTERRHNTPIVQNYNGFSVYSSILNENLLYFYYDKLQISMDEESVSRYDGMGERTNLYSILNGQFYMRDKTSDEVPYGFTPELESETYQVFENSFLLPAFRKTDVLFSEEQLIDAPILTREQAMLDGAIVEGTSSGEQLPDSTEVTDYDIELVNASYTGDRLEVAENNGGIRITFPEPIEEGDLYLTFYIERISDGNYLLKVNESKTIRKSPNSIYKTGFNTVTIRVEASNQVDIKLRKGSYQFQDLEIFHEDYQNLRQAYAQATAEEPVAIRWEDGSVEGQVSSEHPGELIVTPIPYEKGWHLEVNGEEQPVERVNYAFIGIPLEEGTNEIHMVYLPPYFGFSLILSLIGIVSLGYVIYQERRRKDNRL